MHFMAYSDGWKGYAHSVPSRQVGYVHTALLVSSVMVALQETHSKTLSTFPSTHMHIRSQEPAHAPGGLVPGQRQSPAPAKHA